MTVMVALAGIGTLWGMVRPNQINHAMAIAAALWVYGLAYFALRKTIVYSAELRQLLAEPLDFPTAPPLLLKEGSIAAQSNLGLLPIFARTHTTDIENDIAADVQQMEQDAKHLLQFMEEQHPYLEHQLTLQKLALFTGFPAYRISDILNKHLSLNFFDFVNRYRIDEWKRRAQEAPQSITIQELAYSVGFNSKSSFNAAFKKHTGQTPSEYRAHYGME
jgi:AraC-like DNA-binding protein